MEFTVPKNPPPLGEESSLKESSESTEIMEFQGEDLNSFDNEPKEQYIVETVDSNQLGTNASLSTSIPRPSGTTTEQDASPTDSSNATFKEEVLQLYSYLPEMAHHFTIIKMIGEGTFSSVYLAKLRHHPELNTLFAMKHIIPTSHPYRIENELQCLLAMGHIDNVMGVHMCFRNRDHVMIVMPYFPHKKFHDYLYDMSVEEARDYMKNLLLALRRVHRFEVIHRDVKPSNFLYDRKKQEHALVDFGLATGRLLSDPSKRRHKPKPSNLSSSSTSRASAQNASTSHSRSRLPLSPSKKEAGACNSSNIAKSDLVRGEDKKATPISSTTKMFAPNFSSASAIDRQAAIGLCSCFGKPVICELCVSRSIQVAPRAGTAGFRSPEVLLKSPDQTTAVDIWAAGVIFLSILSARYPFFKATEDLGFLAQIISLLGTERCTKAARSFGKVLTISESIPPVDLEVALKRLRLTQMTGQMTGQSGDSPPQDNTFIDSWSDLSSDAYHLLDRMLDPNPATRISAEAAMKHPYFTRCLAKNKKS